MTSRKPPPPCTAEQFAALVSDLRAELGAADRTRRDQILSHQQQGTHAPPPASFAGRPWTAALADLRQAAEITGYSYYTLHVFAAPAAERHWPYALFPPPVVPRLDGAGRRWRVAHLAVWAAGRDPERGKGNLVNYPRRERHPRERKDLSGYQWQQTGVRRRRREITAAVAFAAALVAADPAVTAAEAKVAAGQAGVNIRPARRTMDAARAQALPHVLERITPARPDGLATAREIADAFGVSAARVKGAIGRSEITAAGQQGKQTLADPARLRYRKETAAGRRNAPAPVDRDHPAAVPLPGDRQEEEP